MLLCLDTAKSEEIRQFLLKAAQDMDENMEIMEIHERWLWVRKKNGEEEPVYLDARLESQIEEYFALAVTRPELFRSMGEKYPITLDRKAMLNYMESNPGKALGLVYSNCPYTYTLSDLIDGKYAYARVVPCAAEAGGVILPVFRDADGTIRIGLLVNARHAPRIHRMVELPRGHLEVGDRLPQEDNALKELREELKISSQTVIESIRELGCVHPDSGLTAGLVRIYQVTLRGRMPNANVGEEGIQAIIWKTRSEVLQMVRRGEITDGFTKVALLHYFLEEGGE